MIGKIKVKENIQGRITEANKNYVFDRDAEKLDPLFPEEMGKSYTGLKQNRKRMLDKTEFPDRLPTASLTPYPIDEDDFIGQFESKKNLYLTLAHAFNKAMERIEALEKQVSDLTNV